MTYPGHKLGDPTPAQHPRYFQKRPLARRILFVVGYEGLSVLFTVVVLSALLGHGGGTSTLTAILVSTVATGWNYIWNTAFEALERKRGASGRGAGSRAMHAIGYEGGVLLFTIPLVAIMLGVNLLEAFAIEGGLLVFFLVFTVVYTWIFDRAFGLPASATPVQQLA
ncbi:PACE efflux transporter [Leucobacter insecticola]|uniref:PACE efflux transporter n=1 Tax=Leucobacter insecticola TaxID=2714934 RepID=A0A6G8FFM6_9MICO|nr:PACE efflux transporter [Leucobacter insecticola]QIM15210.1 PACE efflux transporter [Leucobacter insecticola]